MVLQGYDKLATFLGAHPEFQFFRRFSTLSTKNLLYLQADLTILERELANIVEEDKEHATQEKRKLRYPFSLSDLKTSAEDPTLDSYQWDKVKEVREVLNQYHTALLHHAQLLDFHAPAKIEAAGLRKWLRHVGLFKPLVENDVWEPNNEADLIAISRRHEEVDSFTKWLCTEGVDWFHRTWGRREKNKYDLEMGARTYDYNLIRSYTYRASVLISGLLPASSITILYFLKDGPAKLMVVSAYSIMFSWVLGFLVKARRAEIFAAATAFAAVQVTLVANAK